MLFLGRYNNYSKHQAPVYGILLLRKVRPGKRNIVTVMYIVTCLTRAERRNKAFLAASLWAVSSRTVTHFILLTFAARAAAVAVISVFTSWTKDGRSRVLTSTQPDSWPDTRVCYKTMHSINQIQVFYTTSQLARHAHVLQNLPFNPACTCPTKSVKYSHVVHHLSTNPTRTCSTKSVN